MRTGVPSPRASRSVVLAAAAALAVLTLGCSSTVGTPKATRPGTAGTDAQPSASATRPSVPSTGAPGQSVPSTEPGLLALPAPPAGVCATLDPAVLDHYLSAAFPAASGFTGVAIITVYGLQPADRSYDFEVSAGTTGYQLLVRGGSIAESRTYDISRADNPDFVGALQRIVKLYYVSETDFPPTVVLNADRASAGGPWRVSNCTFDPGGPTPAGE